MDMRLLALGGGLLALAVFSGWRGARPPDPRRGARMIPWRFLMMIAAAGAIVVLAQAAQAGAH